ncbi:MAG: serine hydrolase [Cyclobacteriaceae bacterium]
MSKPVIYCLCFCLIWSCAEEKNPLKKVIAGDSFLQTLAQNPDHEVQIIYTKIDRDENQKPHFTTYTFQYDSERYIYPASTVKLPVALLALEEIENLRIKGLTANSFMVTDSASVNQTAVYTDATASNLKPSVAQYIKKILLTSDNDAYNRLYEFLGQDTINENLRRKGYDETRIIHRLSLPLTPEENLLANPITFFENDTAIYELPLRKSSGRYHTDKQVFKGKGYEKNGKTVMEPFDFTYKNFFPLHEQHRMLMALFFPDQFPAHQFRLPGTSHDLIYRYMGMMPQESEISSYQNREDYWPAYVKFLMYGSAPDTVPPANIRIFNKIGQAYGYLIDNAYIVDFDNNVEFILSAVIHVNKNKIYNDGVYEYDSIGFPFMAEVGKAVYKMELERTKPVKPELQRLEQLFEEQ